jgi:hypothetical protein
MQYYLTTQSIETLAQSEGLPPPSHCYSAFLPYQEFRSLSLRLLTLVNHPLDDGTVRVSASVNYIAGL